MRRYLFIPPPCAVVIYPPFITLSLEYSESHDYLLSRVLTEGIIIKTDKGTIEPASPWNMADVILSY